MLREESLPVGGLDDFIRYNLGSNVFIFQDYSIKIVPHMSTDHAGYQDIAVNLWIGTYYQSLLYDIVIEGPDFEKKLKVGLFFAGSQYNISYASVLMASLQVSYLLHKPGCVFGKFTITPVSSSFSVKWYSSTGQQLFVSNSTGYGNETSYYFAAKIDSLSIKDITLVWNVPVTEKMLYNGNTVCLIDSVTSDSNTQVINYKIYSLAWPLTSNSNHSAASGSYTINITTLSALQYLSDKVRLVDRNTSVLHDFDPYTNYDTVKNLTGIPTISNINTYIEDCAVITTNGGIYFLDRDYNIIKLDIDTSIMSFVPVAANDKVVIVDTQANVRCIPLDGTKATIIENGLDDYNGIRFTSKRIPVSIYGYTTQGSITTWIKMQENNKILYAWPSIYFLTPFNRSTIKSFFVLDSKGNNAYYYGIEVSFGIKFAGSLLPPNYVDITNAPTTDTYSSRPLYYGSGYMYTPISNKSYTV